LEKFGVNWGGVVEAFREDRGPRKAVEPMMVVDHPVSTTVSSKVKMVGE
jgi:hypothetical protein